MTLQEEAESSNSCTGRKEKDHENVDETTSPGKDVTVSTVEATCPEQAESPAKEESHSPSSSSTSTGGELHETPVVKSKKGSFVPKDIDVNWVPKEADIVWTRFDKSRTQALAIIVRRPSSKEAETYNASNPSVYCDTDGPDRYLVAFINSDTHFYPPRHYMVKFNFNTAPTLKCMKAKVNSLSNWDKTKRKAVRDALAYAQGAHKFESSHNFRACSICCEEGSDEFWKSIGLERGDAEVDMTLQAEKQKARLKRAQERKEREAMKATIVREKTRRSLRARTRDGTKIKSKRHAGSDESDEGITTISDTESHISNEASHTDGESGAVASEEETAADEMEDSSGEESENDDDDASADDFKPRGKAEDEEDDDDEDVDEALLRRQRPTKKKVAGRAPRKSAPKPSQKRVKLAVSEVEICAQKESTDRPPKRRKEAEASSENKASPTEGEHSAPPG